MYVVNECDLGEKYKEWENCWEAKKTRVESKRKRRASIDALMLSYLARGHYRQWRIAEKYQAVTLVSPSNRERVL